MELIQGPSHLPLDELRVTYDSLKVWCPEWNTVSQLWSYQQGVGQTLDIICLQLVLTQGDSWNIWINSRKQTSSGNLKEGGAAILGTSVCTIVAGHAAPGVYSV